MVLLVPIHDASEKLKYVLYGMDGFGREAGSAGGGDLRGFIWDGESEGETEGTTEGALTGDSGRSMRPSESTSPNRLSGRGGYAVPLVFFDTGDRGLLDEWD
jgi:hypothetical protein